MQLQRERSRRNIPHQWALAGDIPKSEFTGYRVLMTETKLVGIRKEGEAANSAREGDQVEVFLERTPFYAESGGQIGDTGTVTTPSGRVRVEDTQRPADGVIAHLGTVVTGEVRVGEKATASVDASRRAEIARHH